VRAELATLVHTAAFPASTDPPLLGCTGGRGVGGGREWGEEKRAERSREEQRE
jgi:hypothetical protein